MSGPQSSCCSMFRSRSNLCRMCAHSTRTIPRYGSVISQLLLLLLLLFSLHILQICNRYSGGSGTHYCTRRRANPSCFGRSCRCSRSILQGRSSREIHYFRKEYGHYCLHFTHILSSLSTVRKCVKWRRNYPYFEVQCIHNLSFSPFSPFTSLPSCELLSEYSNRRTLHCWRSERFSSWHRSEVEILHKLIFNNSKIGYV